MIYQDGVALGSCGWDTSRVVSHSCRLLVLFIRAERTRNWDLHLYAVSEMIPILHAAAHLAINVKSKNYQRLCHKQNLGHLLKMVILQSEGKMSFELETSRTRHEQALVGMLRAPVGLAHGPGGNYRQH